MRTITLKLSKRDANRLRKAKNEIRQKRVAEYAQINKLFGQLDEEVQKTAMQFQSFSKTISKDIDTTLKTFPLGGITGKLNYVPTINEHVISPDILTSLKRVDSIGIGVFGSKRWSRQHSTSPPADPDLE